MTNVPANRRAIIPANKAMLSMRIDPNNKKRALKLLDEAIKLAAGDEDMLKSLNQFRAQVDGKSDAKPAGK
jgi:hypothetical protein